MKVLEKLMLVLCVFLLLGTGPAMALDFGVNITIPDNNNSSSHDWYGNREDQEVEPGMVHTQVWDLEGFFLKGATLSVVGGYNFRTGQDGYKAGDIFIDVDGGAQYGDIHGTGVNGNTIVNDTFGYDYVLDLDFCTNSTNNTYNYKVYSLKGININPTTKTAYYTENYGSNPWIYVDGGTFIKSGTFTFMSELTNAQTGFFGGSHYAMTGFDLSFLPNLDFIVHTTMGCGNDNLMGQNPVPEPATMLLLGTGLMGLAGIGRKKLFKK